MNDIICPHCQKAFKVDESGYADILKQVRDSEFEQQLHDRLELAEKDKLNAVKLAKQSAVNEMQKTASAKDAEIQALKAKLEGEALERKLAVTEALKAIEQQRDKLAAELAQAKQDKQAASQLSEAQLLQKLQEAEARKDAEIQQLKARLEASETTHKLAVTQAVNTVEKNATSCAITSNMPSWRRRWPKRP